MRLIDADKILKKVHYANTLAGYMEIVFVEEIENAPTIDAVEVVRCKDCIHAVDEETNNIYTCKHYPFGLGGYQYGEDFCSEGKRREEDA